METNPRLESVESTFQVVRKLEVSWAITNSGALYLIGFIVSLARAIYSRASVLLLDDVLSAGAYIIHSYEIS